MDPNAWDWENPIDVVVAEHPLAQLPIDFTFEEIRTIEESARAAGMSPHSFIKETALAAARWRP